MPQFADAWNDTRQELLGELEQRAKEIALGPVTQQSALLLIFLMKASDPEMYCDIVRGAKHKARIEKEAQKMDPVQSEADRQFMIKAWLLMTEAKRKAPEVPVAHGDNTKAASACGRVEDRTKHQSRRTEVG